jgi:hypothetical protein
MAPEDRAGGSKKAVAERSMDNMGFYEILM